MIQTDPRWEGEEPYLGPEECGTATVEQQRVSDMRASRRESAVLPCSPYSCPLLLCRPLPTPTVCTRSI